MCGSFFLRALQSAVFPLFRPPAQPAAEMSKTVTLYICVAGCAVRCGYLRLLAMIFKNSSKIQSWTLDQEFFAEIL